MKTRVLVVDDSSFFRRRIVEILDADKHLEVVGTASNGREAVSIVEQLRPDVITMDIEMPIMDGITATRQIMKSVPTPILMFSSLTKEGAKATFDALEAGAMDFLPKSLTDIAGDKESSKRVLCARIRILGAKGVANRLPGRMSPAVTESRTSGTRVRPDLDISRLKLILIGTSTGGPAALQRILSSLQTSFPVPIIVIQHMPESFTEPFAQRLDSICEINVKQASSGDIVKKGRALIAPGGHQLEVRDSTEGMMIKITPATKEQTYKPCVDVTFNSVAELFPGELLAIILTGMGSDGTEGSRNIKNSGSHVWAQDEQSSVVYGMPMSVAKEGLADRVMSLDDIITALQN